MCMKRSSVSKLVRRFKEIMDGALLPLEWNADGESIALLHQTGWVRMLVIRRLVDTIRVSIVVELALPRYAYSRVAESQEQAKQGLMRADTCALLEGMLVHLQYLRNLHESGFALEMIEHGCLWTASRDFTEMPSEDMFKLLLPP